MDAALATIEADAREFGLHDRQGPWRLGLLIARSVTVGKDHGVNLKYRDEDVSHETSSNGKVSARDFAMMSGTSTKRVMKYFRAWEKAAKEGLVPQSSELEPGQELNTLLVDRLPDWGKYYEVEQRPGIGSAPRLYPPSAPRKVEDRSENVDYPSILCEPFPTAEKQIKRLELELQILMGPRYKLGPKSREKLESILLIALEEVRNYGANAEKRKVPTNLG